MRIVLRDEARAEWLTFSAPAAIVAAHELASVVPVLRSIERRVADEGLWAAGFVTYESASAFDPACTTLAPGSLPLLVFGLFHAVERSPELDTGPERPAPPIEWHLDTAQQDYMAKVDRIREQIALGNTYQINYTIRGRSPRIDDPWQLFLDIAQDAPLAAYVEDAHYAIVSASPELFFRLDGNALMSRPMKGTAARGLSAAEDKLRRQALASSAKDRAENVMIADMLRNDMGRVAEPGSVVAESLFDVEKHRTVWQATSTVSAETQRSVSEVFGALFPCASITGAPKIASMQLISELEQSPRGIYTGAIGYIAPDRKAQFNVAIRTAHIERATSRAEYGVGGGIVWDSRPAAEYAECLAKCQILRHERRPPQFQLIETMLWTKDAGYFLLQGHLSRLRDSADYFDFACDAQAIVADLQRLAANLRGDRHRVRLLLSRHGEIVLSETALAEVQAAAPVRARLAARPIDARNVFLYHKTTHRAVYDAASEGNGDCDEVLLWNEDGLLTESTIANIAVRLDGELYTPPVHCGLLPGVLRESLLQSGRLRERPLKKTELAKAEEILLLNSVRQMYACELLT